MDCSMRPLTFCAIAWVMNDPLWMTFPLLDEPCAGVNPSLVGGISTLLKDLNRQPAGAKKSSFVVIEHNMDFVMDLCHRIMVMVEGKVKPLAHRKRFVATNKCSTHTWEPEHDNLY